MTTFRFSGRRDGLALPAYDRTTTHAHVCELFAMVVDRLPRTTHAFVTGDRIAASKVVASEPEVDRLQLDAEELASRALMANASTASADDLRYLLSVLRIVPEIERSADLVEHIALRTGLGTTEVLSNEARELFAAMDDLHVRVTQARTNSSISTSVAMELGLVARFFERLGDHAVNVTRRLELLGQPAMNGVR